ncbi:hypothetical protein PEC18_29475 [Paucibacter sp. O1-1]|nr:hypothetical protein [Paucibacter sp. O1-1]MDA3829872.1 hypothetical protein [Paucibacter sp. O1-1]
MKETLAKRLVADMMEWSMERATTEFAWLDLMVNYKFDNYQQYGPGHRFYVHLLRWLSQYPKTDRERMWRLLREQLVYVSQDELHHLVSLTGPVIERQMRTAVARELELPVYRVDEDPQARRRLAEMQCRTLYVGVSDGARIDVFRRYNEGTVNNEQVVAMIEISELKQRGLKEKLQERLDAIKLTAPPTFEWVCLIDDFTASGTTSIRDEGNGNWGGKVQRFMKEVSTTIATAPLITPDAHIQVHHYLASRLASEKVSNLLGQFQAQSSGLRFIPSFSYVLPEDVVIAATSHPDLSTLLVGRYDPGIETSHTGQDIALGYKQCGLPLVLDHNTPNNSVATLWARSNDRSPKHLPQNHMSPLFPRRQRHSDVRP